MIFTISPLTIAQNSTIEFLLPTGQLTQDEVGNVIDKKKIYIQKAYLKKRNIQDKTIYIPTDSENLIYVEGYCVQPKKLDLRVNPDQWGVCNYGGLKGRFYLMAPINPPHGREGIGAIIEQAVGTKISGWFQPSKDR